MFCLMSCTDYENKVNEYFENKEYKKVISICKTMLARKVNEVDCYLNMGSAHMRLHEYELAEDSYTKALAHASIKDEVNDRRYKAVYANRSYCRIKLGKIDLAISDAKKAIELDPHWDLLYLNLLQIYIDTDQLDLAKELLEQIHKKFHSDTKGDYIVLKKYYELGDIEYVIKKSTMRLNDELVKMNAWQLDVGFRSLEYLRGISFIQSAKISKAIPDLIRSQELWAEGSRGYGTLAYAYYQANQIEKAKASYQKAMEIEPKYRADIDGLTGIFNGTDEAKAVFKKILKLIDAER